MLKMHTSKKSIVIIKCLKVFFLLIRGISGSTKYVLSTVLNARPYNFSSSEIYRSLNTMMLHRSKQEDS